MSECAVKMSDQEYSGSKSDYESTKSIDHEESNSDTQEPTNEVNDQHKSERVERQQSQSPKKVRRRSTRKASRCELKSNEQRITDSMTAATKAAENRTPNTDIIKQSRKYVTLTEKLHNRAAKSVKKLNKTTK